jgi:hypothetical protein
VLPLPPVVVSDDPDEDVSVTGLPLVPPEQATVPMNINEGSTKRRCRRLAIVVLG